jgi:hypothetical protein
MLQPQPLWPQDRRVLHVTASALLILGCTSSHKTFSFGAPGLEHGFRQWKDTVHPNDREIIDQLERDESLVIHIINGQVTAQRSRVLLTA